jgi:hypothetical protein
MFYEIVGEQKGFQGEIVAALDIASVYGFFGLLHKRVDLTKGSLLGQVKLSRRQFVQVQIR